MKARRLIAAVIAICSTASVCVADSNPVEPSLVFSLQQDQPEKSISAAANGDLSHRPRLAPGPMHGPVTVRAERSDLSLPLTWMPVVKGAPARIAIEIPIRRVPPKGLQQRQRDSLVQDSPFSTDISVTPNIPSTSVNFDGISNQWNVYPPDTNGAVGPNHYVQTVNLGYAVYDKSGNALLTPRNTNTIWSGFGGPCATTNHGDPIVLHDQLADRWLISQFSVNGPYYQCIAISQTADPTGAYHRYAFLWSNTLMNDYPHFGVWPDAYYMSVNEFTNGATFAGAGAGAFEREKMLVGDPAARLVVFHQINDGGQLPSDLDGSTPPPPGAPNYFADWENSAVHIWKFRVDWNNTASSSFTSFAQIAAAPFDSTVCTTRNCIPQPNTTAKLDAITDRYMFRLAYRNFGTHESLVTNHTVDVGSAHAAVRWYEVRSPGNSPVVHQQGTYAPDAHHRWMGSVAMDQAGNIAMGYSVSSSTLFPSIRYTGRLVSDPLGTMPQGEATVIAGSGSQTGTASRWGDYSAMSVDPVDDCTFWYTTEYYQTTGTVNWRTRVASFKFPNCGSAPTCNAPSGLSNNTVSDVSACADSGVRVTWSQDPSNWGDSSGTRSYDVLRNGVPIANVAYLTTSYVDTTGANGTTYTYSVRYNNGCGLGAITAGASAADNVSTSVTQTAKQSSSSITARNNSTSTALVPTFSIAKGQASSASVSWHLSGNTNLVTCTIVRLQAPSGTRTTMKAAGASNTTFNATNFYNAQGPGTYRVVLQENSGCGPSSARATLTSTVMTVQKSSSCP